MHVVSCHPHDSLVLRLYEHVLTEHVLCTITKINAPFSFSMPLPPDSFQMSSATASTSIQMNPANASQQMSLALETFYTPHVCVTVQRRHSTATVLITYALVLVHIPPALVQKIAASLQMHPVPVTGQRYSEPPVSAEHYINSLNVGA